MGKKKSRTSSNEVFSSMTDGTGKQADVLERIYGCNAVPSVTLSLERTRRSSLNLADVSRAALWCLRDDVDNPTWFQLTNKPFIRHVCVLAIDGLSESRVLAENDSDSGSSGETPCGKSHDTANASGEESSLSTNKLQREVFPYSGKRRRQSKEPTQRTSIPALCASGWRYASLRVGKGNSHLPMTDFFMLRVATPRASKTTPAKNGLISGGDGGGASSRQAFHENARSVASTMKFLRDEQEIISLRNQMVHEMKRTEQELTADERFSAPTYKTTIEECLMTQDELLTNNFPIDPAKNTGYSCASHLDHCALASSNIENRKEECSCHKERNAPPRVIGLDCEMVLTEEGVELARVTLVDGTSAPSLWKRERHEGSAVSGNPDCTDSDMHRTSAPQCRVLVDLFVRPMNPVVNYLTQYSGITEEILRNVTLTREDATNMLLRSFISMDTILVGHSLENDLHALRLCHTRVCDTSIMYPHPCGHPRKHALRYLTKKYLNRLIQVDTEGHSSEEDATACVELLYKIRQHGKAFGVEKTPRKNMLLDMQGEGEGENNKVHTALIDRGDFIRPFIEGSVETFTPEKDSDVLPQVLTFINKIHNSCDTTNEKSFVWAHLSDTEGHPNQELNAVLGQFFTSLPKNTIVMICGLHVLQKYPDSDGKETTSPDSPEQKQLPMDTNQFGIFAVRVM